MPNNHTNYGLSKWRGDQICKILITMKSRELQFSFSVSHKRIREHHIKRLEHRLKQTKLNLSPYNTLFGCGIPLYRTGGNLKTDIDTKSNEGFMEEEEIY